MRKLWLWTIFVGAAASGLACSSDSQISGFGERNDAANSSDSSSSGADGAGSANLGMGGAGGLDASAGSANLGMGGTGGLDASAGMTNFLDGGMDSANSSTGDGGTAAGGVDAGSLDAGIAAGGQATGGRGSGGASTGGRGSGGRPGSGGWGGECPPTCLIANECVTTCGETPTNYGCCPCPRGMVNVLSCNDPNDGVSCDRRAVLCRALPPDCRTGTVPSVDGTCWGPCVPIDACVCSGAEDCPNEEMYTCHNSAGRCGPYL